MKWLKENYILILTFLLLCVFVACLFLVEGRANANTALQDQLTEENIINCIKSGVIQYMDSLGYRELNLTVKDDSLVWWFKKTEPKEGLK